MIGRVIYTAGAMRAVRPVKYPWLRGRSSSGPDQRWPPGGRDEQRGRCRRGRRRRYRYPHGLECVGGRDGLPGERSRWAVRGHLPCSTAVAHHRQAPLGLITSGFQEVAELSCLSCSGFVRFPRSRCRGENHRHTIVDRRSTGRLCDGRSSLGCVISGQSRKEPTRGVGPGRCGVRVLPADGTNTRPYLCRRVCRSTGVRTGC